MELGWFDSKTRYVKTQSGDIMIDIASFVDFGSSHSHAVLVVVDGLLFLQNNRRKLLNQETQEFADAVTVTKRESTTMAFVRVNNVNMQLYSRQAVRSIGITNV